MTRLLLVGTLALGLAASVLAQSAPLSAGAERAAVAHLRAQAIDIGLTADEVADLVGIDGHRSEGSGLDIVYVQQHVGGIPVADRIVTVALDARGTAVHVAGELVPVSGPRQTAALSASEALAIAARRLGATALPTTPLAIDPVDPRVISFGEVAGFAVTARPVYVSDGRAARLAWEVVVPTHDAQHLWLVRLDASSGAELSRHDLTVHDHWDPRPPSGSRTPLVDAIAAPTLALADGSVYDVYPLPIESPNHAPIVPPADGRTEAPAPADALASPFGWHDTDGVAGAEHTLTWGNNVRAYNDRAADNTGTAADAADCGASLACLFPLDLSMEPSAYTDAAVTSLFYWTNVAHDVAYRYGFDEAAGNFQSNTYGNGGLGGDALRAEAQDGSGSNGANMTTPPDGAPPRMQMSEWSFTTPRVDAAFDAGVVVHEYTHGITNRLTGGPGTVSCLNNAEQMGEGWSDWFALMLTQRPGDTGPQRRGLGTYLLGQSTTGTGIRSGVYSTDVAENDATYGDTQTAAIPHGVGFVWATVLWEVTWELIDAHGYTPDVYGDWTTGGNTLALQLVTDGLKLQPCGPGFVDGRDAILAADQALTGGANQERLWAAFARRGLGVSASQGSANSNTDNVEAFDTPLPPGVVAITPASLDLAAPSGGIADGDVTISHTGVSGDGSVQYTASITRQDQPAATLLGTGGPDAFGYVWVDSDEAGGPAVAFHDISGTGTAVTFTPTGSFPGGDEGFFDVALPFAFPFYGTDRSSVRVMSNGFLTFSAFASNSFTNQPFPNAATPNDVIAPFFDDLDQSQGGTVYTGTLPDGRFAVQYDEVPQWDDATASLTFQAILAPDGTIEFQYETMTASALDDATVGTEDATGTVGLQVVFSAPYVTSNKAVRISSPALWASASPASGTILPGGSDAVTVSVDASALPDGVYTADLTIETNDPALPSTVIPVTLTVGGASGVSILIDGPRGVRFLGTPSAGLTVDDLAAMNLVRGVPGYYPAANPANLHTHYDPEAATWIPSAGTGEVLELGRAFRWLFYDHSNGNPAISQSVPLPMTLTTTRPPNTADVTLLLDTGGTRFNVLANPFGTDLDLTGITSWPGSEHLAPFPAQTYDPVAQTWVDAPGTIGPWQAFRVRAKGPRVGDRPRMFTIPASAASPPTSARAARSPAPRAEPEVTEVALSRIAPNPSAGSARVSFAIPEAGTVRVSVIDVRGREVAILVDGPLAAGRHEATLDSGSLAAGVYVVRLEAAGAVVTRQAAVVH